MYPDGMSDQLTATLEATDEGVQMSVTDDDGSEVESTSLAWADIVAEGVDNWATFEDVDVRTATATVAVDLDE